MPDRIAGRVVVVTGASSGIGRATALEFARRGAAVAVAARRADALDEVAEACRALGAPAVSIPTDVTDDAAVRALADGAAAALGGLDVWVNNAGVSLLAPFEQTPHDAWRRVIETNLLGFVHGAWAALPHFRRAGRGVLVMNASVYGRVGGQYLTAYTASKWAIRGFSESLRQELRGTGIDVCTVLPASIDTPIFQHAGNLTGRGTKALRPVNDAGQVVRAIVGCVERPRREILVGRGARGMVLMHDLTPALHERVGALQVEHDHLSREPLAPTLGNLFEPDHALTGIDGGWQRRGRGRRLALAGLAVAPALLAVRGLSRRTNGGRTAGDARAIGSASVIAEPAVPGADGV